jgi:hypothetical protein
MFGFRKKRAGSTKTGEQWFVTGRGLDRGYDWDSKQMLGGALRQSDISWFAGFLSGISLERDENILANHTFDEAVEWLDALCRANPNDQICHSAQKVAAKLIGPESDIPIPSN